MKHLSDREFIDLLDDRLERERRVHVDECPACSSQLQTMAAALSAIETDEAPEPSPLFWEAFPSRVNRALDAPQAWRFAFKWRAGLATAAMLVVAGVVGVTLRERSHPPAVQQTAAPTPDAPAANPSEVDIEDDAAWAVVRMAADDLDYDDVLAEGIRPAPDAFDRLTLELTDSERAELVRLLERELKRPGA